jgi:hypothetical protein
MAIVAFLSAIAELSCLALEPISFKPPCELICDSIRRDQRLNLNVRSMPPASSGSRRSRPMMIQPMRPATSNRRRF